MHISDAFLTPGVWGAAIGASTVAVAVSLKKTRDTMDDRNVPMIGMLSAFVFAAQMLNFPIGGGTSGHFMGACLAAVLLGPWAATLAMASVLIVQCLVYQDGGLLALGANILNMGVLGVWGSWAVYRLVGRVVKDRSIPVFAGAWVSIVLAALACSFELVASGVASGSVVIPAMTGVHAVIGLVEAVITVAVVRTVSKVRPDIAASGVVSG